MTHPLATIEDQIRENYLRIVNTNTSPTWDAVAAVAVDTDGQIGWEVFETAQAAGLIAVDDNDYQDTLDRCFKIADEVQSYLQTQIPAARLRAAQEANR